MRKKSSLFCTHGFEFVYLGNLPVLKAQVGDFVFLSVLVAFDDISPGLGEGGDYRCVCRRASDFELFELLDKRGLGVA